MVLKDSITGWFLKGIPKKAMSHLVGDVVRTRLPGPISGLSVKAFASYYNINMDEAEKPISEYKTIGDLFVRKLKAEVRPIGIEPLHPADAKLTQLGKIQGERLIQAKGRSYSLNEFLVDPELVDSVKGGSFFTYYLCPTDYHRVHSPVSGKIRRAVLVPGQLWPVNDWSVENIQDLFAINERVIVEIATPQGNVIVVMVGATNVGKMEMVFDPFLKPAQNDKQPIRKSYSPNVEINAGDELGVFHMGSTVIVLYPEGYNGTESVSPGPTKVNSELGSRR